MGNAPFGFAFLIGLLLFRTGGAMGGFGLSFLCQCNEFREIAGFHVRPGAPESAFQVWNLAVETGDRFKMHRHAGAEFGETLQISLPIDQAFPGSSPLDGRAMFRFPDHAVAEAGCDDVRAENSHLFQSKKGLPLLGARL